ncbi:MAG: response regulator [Gemmatimonadetes bacterium]|nr:response regulator [Gemmatimonadota bacterium]
MLGTVLVDDDEPHIVRAVKNALAADFSRVLEAATAREAVDLAAAQRPDLVVLDLGLPDRPGLWVLAELRTWSVVPVIVLSAHRPDSPGGIFVTS